MPETSPMACDAINLVNPPEAVPVEASPSAEGMGILNDEVMIDVPPARPCGTIRVKLVYAGRSMPIPADDPWAE